MHEIIATLWVGQMSHVIQTGDTFSEAVWSHIYFTRQSIRQGQYGTMHIITKSGLVWRQLGLRYAHRKSQSRGQPAASSAVVFEAHLANP